jgi:N-acetylneuraminic acid mutarotase
MKNSMKHFLLAALFILTVFISISGCGSLAEPQSAGSATISVSDTGQGSALLTMTFVNPGGISTIPSAWFEVTGSGSVGDSAVACSPNGNSSIWTGSCRLSGLTEGVIYSTFSHIIISGVTYNSAVIHFTTSKPAAEWVSLAHLQTENGVVSNSIMLGGESCFGMGDVYQAKTNSWSALPYKFPIEDIGTIDDPYKTGPLFMIGGSLYRFSAYAQYLDVLESIDTSTLQVTRYTNPALQGRTSMIIFSIAGSIYAGGGHHPNILNTNYYKDLWKFNPQTKSWKRLNDLPMNGHQAFFSNAVAGKGYAVIGVVDTVTYLTHSETWKYDAALDSWAKLSIPPSSLAGTSGSCTDGQSIFMVSGSDLWAFTPATDSYQKLDSRVPTQGTLGTDGTIIYLLGPTDGRFWKYAP